MDHSDPGTEVVLPPKTLIISKVKTNSQVLNECVLHQKYVLERLSCRQIAREFASSRSTILEALKQHKIPLRATGHNHANVHLLPFGKKKVKGKIVDHKRELRTLATILKWNKEGLSNCAIARKLTELNVPTKQGGKRWHAETVRSLLLRHQKKSHWK